VTEIKDGLVPELTAPAIEAGSELREKNEITMPKPIADVLVVHAGDRFVWVVEDSERGVVRLHRLPSSYAASLARIYGRPDQVEAYLTAEREAWGE
jgi:hypothetical protein